MGGLIFLLPRAQAPVNPVRNIALQYPNTRRIFWAPRAYPKDLRQAHARANVAFCQVQASYSIV